MGTYIQINSHQSVHLFSYFLFATFRLVTLPSVKSWTDLPNVCMIWLQTPELKRCTPMSVIMVHSVLMIGINKIQT